MADKKKARKTPLPRQPLLARLRSKAGRVTLRLLFYASLIFAVSWTAGASFYPWYWDRFQSREYPGFVLYYREKFIQAALFGTAAASLIAAAYHLCSRRLFSPRKNQAGTTGEKALRELLLLGIAALIIFLLTWPMTWSIFDLYWRHVVQRYSGFLGIPGAVRESYKQEAFWSVLVGSALTALIAGGCHRAAVWARGGNRPRK